MTKFLNPVKWVACLIILSLSFACRKDHCMRNYTYYIPVFEKRNEAYNNITKDNHARNIVRPGKMVISGSHIFLNDYARGIHIIDNSDPRKPVQAAFIKIAGNIDIAVKGNILYADFNTDLITLDISDIQHVKILDSIRNVFPWRYNMGYMPLTVTSAMYSQVITDSTLIVADWIRKDTIMDCERNSTVPTAFRTDNSLASQAAGNASTAGSMASFAITGSYLYALAGWQLKSFNIDQPQHPSLSSVISEFNTLETIFPFSNKLFVGSPNGMLIYSLGMPAQPVREGMFSHARVCDPVITDGKYAYVTLRSGTACGGFTNQLDILDVSDVASPGLLNSYKFHNPHGLSKDGNLLFVCDEKDGLKLYDVHDGKTLILTDHVGGLNAYDVIAQDHLAIVSADEGLYQYDYTNKYQVKFLSKIGWKKQ